MSGDILVVPTSQGSIAGSIWGFYCQLASEPILDSWRMGRRKAVKLAPGEKTTKTMGCVSVFCLIWWFRIKNVDGEAVVRAWPRPLPRT